MQDEAANQLPQDSERVGGRMAGEPNARQNVEDEASQRLAFTAPFRSINVRSVCAIFDPLSGCA